MGARRALLGAWLLTVVAASSGCPPPEPLCDALEPLLAMDGFTLVDPLDDPFQPAADAPLCTADEVRAEPFGNGPMALDVDTNGRCGWATVVQDTLLELADDDELRFKIFYFSQQTFPASEAELAVRLGDDTLWTTRVPIPTSGDLVDERIAPPRATPTGTPLYFHLGNHGANTWSLLEVLRLRRVPCSEVPADAGAE